MRETFRRLAGIQRAAAAFLLALAIAVAWLVTGSLFQLPDGWQIVTSTLCQIAMLLVVFVLLFQIGNAPPLEWEERFEEEPAPPPSS